MAPKEEKLKKGDTRNPNPCQVCAHREKDDPLETGDRKYCTLIDHSNVAVRKLWIKCGLKCPGYCWDPKTGDFDPYDIPRGS